MTTFALASMDDIFHEITVSVITFEPREVKCDMSGDVFYAPKLKTIESRYSETMEDAKALAVELNGGKCRHDLYDTARAEAYAKCAELNAKRGDQFIK